MQSSQNQQLPLNMGNGAYNVISATKLGNKGSSS